MNDDHQPYCDQTHTPRQRCNRVLAPEPDPADRIIDEALSALPASSPSGNGRTASAPTPVVDERPSMVRETIATADAPPPTEFVTREWSKTAGAVEQAYRSDTWVSSTPNRRSGSGPAIAIISAAISLVLVLLFARRRRPGSTADS
jgi:hypothetical protein